MLHDLPSSGLDDALMQRHTRISRVVMGMVAACAIVFVVALCSNSPQKRLKVPAEEQLASIEGFGCATGFLCPHSGYCKDKADKCPEGNPFLAKGGAYYNLILCGPADVCSCEHGGYHKLKCERDGELMLAKWSSTDQGGCSSILCPRSGVCVTEPQKCEEGDPFANKHSAYFREAMAAQFIHAEAEARKAELHEAAARKAAAARAAAGGGAGGKGGKVA